MGSKNLTLRLLLLSFSSIVCLLLFEFYLRATQTPQVTPGYIQSHPTRRYALTPHFTGKTYSAKLQINSHGLRDEEKPISEGEDAHRIAVFGDSITFGVGVELQDTFSKIVERMLNKHCKTPIQVFNFGAGSYNLVTEYQYLIESYEEFKPHLVIFQYTVSNDSEIRRPTASKSPLPPILLIKDLLRYLYFYNWLAERSYQFRYKIDYGILNAKSPVDPFEARLRHDQQLYLENYQGWIETQKTFSKINNFASTRHFPVLFAIYANNIHLASSLESDLMYPLIERISSSLKNQGIKHIVVLDEALRPYSGKEKSLWVRPDDSHLSPLAHQLVADILFEYIVRNKLLPSE